MKYEIITKGDSIFETFMIWVGWICIMWLEIIAIGLPILVFTDSETTCVIGSDLLCNVFMVFMFIMSVLGTNVIFVLPLTMELIRRKW